MTPSLVELNKLLASLYFEQGPSQRVASAAGLQLEKIDWSGAAVNFWFCILDVTLVAAALERLLKIVTDEYAEKKDLIDKLYQEHLTQFQQIDQNASEKHVVDGFMALSELLKLPSVRLTLSDYTENLDTISDQINEISDLKDLHDLLHELQRKCFDPVTQIAKQPTYDQFWSDIDNHEITFQDIFDSIKEIADRPTYEIIKMPRIITPLNEASKLLKDALEQSDLAKLNESLFQISRVLDVQPPRINVELTNASKQLRLNDLVKALTIVRNKVIENINSDDIKFTEVSQFISGFESLDNLDKSLMGLIKTHDTLQYIDSDLRQIEPDLEHSTSDLKLFWDGIAKESKKLNQEQSEGSWAERFAEGSMEMDQALEQNEPIIILRAFRHFRRLITDRFYRVDKNLKSRCDELSRIGSAPLEAVNRALLEAVAAND